MTTMKDGDILLIIFLLYHGRKKIDMVDKNKCPNTSPKRASDEEPARKTLPRGN